MGKINPIIIIKMWSYKNNIQVIMSRMSRREVFTIMIKSKHLNLLNLFREYWEKLSEMMAIESYGLEEVDKLFKEKQEPLSSVKIKDLKDEDIQYCGDILAEYYINTEKLVEQNNKKVEEYFLKNISIKELRRFIPACIFVLIMELEEQAAKNLLVPRFINDTIRDCVLTVLNPCMYIIQCLNKKEFNRLQKIIDHYIGKKDRLVERGMRILYKNFKEEEPIKAKRVNIKQVQVPINVSSKKPKKSKKLKKPFKKLYEVKAGGSNFYNWLGVADIDMDTGTSIDVRMEVYEVLETAFSKTVYDYDNQEIPWVSIEPNEDEELNLFDEAVYTAISLLWRTGHEDNQHFNEYVTPRMIFQVLSLNKDNNHESGDKMDREIIASIEKLRRTTLRIHAPSEYENAVYSHNGSLLPSEWEKNKRISGQIVPESLHLLMCPPLYVYASEIKLLASVPYVDFESSNTIRAIKLRLFLMINIMLAQARKKSSFRIKCKALYKIAGLKSHSDKAHRDVRKKIVSCLVDFQKNGCIQSFKSCKKGVQISEYQIFL